MLSLWYVISKFFISIFFFNTVVMSIFSIHVWIQWNLNSIQSNSGWIYVVLINVTILKKGRKNIIMCCMHYDSKCLSSLYPFFPCGFTFFQHYINISHDHIEFMLFQFSFWVHISNFMNILDSYCFNLLLKTIVSIFYWIDEVSIYHWIGASILIIIFNCCSNSHIKNTNTIPKLHNIDTTDMKKHIRCVLLCPYCWVGSS
jgi:hypothetical protein